MLFVIWPFNVSHPENVGAGASLCVLTYTETCTLKQWNTKYFNYYEIQAFLPWSFKELQSTDVWARLRLTQFYGDFKLAFKDKGRKAWLNRWNDVCCESRALNPNPQHPHKSQTWLCVRKLWCCQGETTDPRRSQASQRPKMVYLTFSGSFDSISELKMGSNRENPCPPWPPACCTHSYICGRVYSSPHTHNLGWYQIIPMQRFWFSLLV